MARALKEVAKREMCVQISTYWLFALSMILLFDIIMEPLVEANIKVILPYIIIRIIMLVALSSEYAIRTFSYIIGINWTYEKKLEESEGVERYYRLFLVVLVLLSALLLLVSYYGGAAPLAYLTLAEILSNSALLALLIRPKSIAIAAATTSLLASLEIIMMSLILGPRANLLTTFFSLSDALAMIGSLLLGVPLCEDVTMP